MKKHWIFTAAFAAILTISCSVEPMDPRIPEEEEGEYTVLSAGFAGEEDGTRTVRQSDGKVFWSPNDAIAIVRGSTRRKFSSDVTAPSPSANFSGNMPSGSSAFWALYPYDASCNIQNSYLVTTLPAQQQAVAGSFANNLFISAAYVRNNTTSLTFHHQCGGVKFSVTQPGIKKVTLIPADDGVYLAGLIGLSASAAGKTPYIAATGSADYMSSSIELSAPEGSTLEVGAAYHFVTIPANLAGGFSLLFEKEDGAIGIRTVDKDVTIQAGHFATLLNADKEVTFEKDFLRYSPGEVSLDGQGGLFSIHVQGTLEYHIDSYSDWITEVSTSGDVRVDRIHGFMAASNEEGAERIGMLTICYGDNCYPIMVTQSAKGAVTAIPHHSLGMRFTATWCQFCPMMDETFHKAKDAMGDAFEYVCIYATSGNYGFGGSDLLSNYYQIGGYPSGILDGRYDLPNYNSSDYGAQVIAEVAEETVRYYSTATAIGIESSLSGRNLSVKVDVKALYEEDYKLTVFLCENNVIGSQQNGSTVVSNFNHSRVTRMSLTDYTGDLFEGPEAGGVKTFNFNAVIPADYNLDNMDVVAFVQRSYGDRPALPSGGYGGWYVDNSRSAAFGAKAALEVE